MLQRTLDMIQPLDTVAMEAVQYRLDSLTKPQGSLGRLEDMIRQYAGITGRSRPPDPKHCIVIACADHGVARRVVSAYPLETTAQMTANYVQAKGASANAFANFCHAGLVVADVGVAADLSHIAGLWHRKIAWGTADVTAGPAMSRSQAVTALETGIAIVAAQVSQGYNCFGLGEMGIGNTTISAAITAAFTGMSPEEVTGRGTGISDARLTVKIEAVRQALAINRPDISNGIDVLAKIGGFEIGTLAGVVLGAAAYRCPAIIDGLNTTAAALIACAIHPGIAAYLLPSHLSGEPAHGAALKWLHLDHCMDMHIRLGEGVGAAVAMNLLTVAVKTLHRMATFADAGVSR